MENRGGADDVAKDSARAGIQEHDFAEEFSSDLPSMAMPLSAPSGSSPYASLSSPSAVKVDDRDVAHGAGRLGDKKKLEHALPTDPRMQLPAAGFGMVDSMGRPPVVYASNSDVGPGAFPVRSARNTATSRTFRSPAIGSYASPREFTNEESKQEDGVPNSAAAGIGVYAVDAQRVPDGNEDGTVLVAEAQYISRMKWYQRRWIVAGLALLACGFAAAVVVLVVRPQSASSSSSLTPPPTVPITGAPSIPELTAAPLTPVPSEDAPSTSEPTTAPPTTAPITMTPATPDPTPPPPTFAPIATRSPTPKPISTAFPTQAPTTRRPTTTSNPISSLTPVAIACNFLSIPNVTKCRSMFEFDTGNAVDKTTGSTIPSEIGLLTQLKYLYVGYSTLTGTIPSEIGLLTQLTSLRFDSNSLVSTIPSEIGLLTQLDWLDFSYNSLTSIPSEIGRLAMLKSLYFGSNALTSTIPSEIGRLAQLLTLDFSINQLTSTIPSEIGLLTQLNGRLNFSNNQLKGTIPSSLCSLPSPPAILIDCGEITCASGCCSGGGGSSCV